MGDAGALVVVVCKAPVQRVMDHEMSNDIGHSHAPPSQGGDSPLPETDVLATSSSGFRGHYLALRGQVANNLKKCHEECDNMAALLNGVRLMSDLNSQFAFKDAFSFAPRPAEDAADRALNALKGRISAALQAAASWADTICTSPEDRERFSKRLERQFGAIRTTLIRDETARAVEKLLGLCARVEDIVEQLSSFGPRLSENRAHLEVMAHSLRLYIRDSLGQPLVQIQPLQQTNTQSREAQVELSVADFFDRLDTLTVDTYNSLRDQAAA